MTRKLLILVLIFCMIFSLSASALAQSGGTGYTLNLNGGDSAQITCPTFLTINTSEGGTIADILCAIATATMIPTATSPPTQTATLSPTQSGNPIEPYLNAPDCIHDPTVWHGLWDYQKGCWYNHTHGDDPSLGDKYFGSLGAYWGGQQISFPFNSGPTENALKHAGYKISVREPGYHPWPPCGVRDQNDATGVHSDNCVVASRVEYHAVGSILDNVHRYHSFWMEVYVCKGITDQNPDPANCGVIRTGGIADYAQLVAPHYGTRIIRQGGTVDLGNGQTTTYTADGPDLPSISGEPYMFVVPYSQFNQDLFNRYPNVGPPGTGVKVKTIDQWAMNDFDCEPHPAGDPCHNPNTKILVQVGDSFTLADTQDLNTVHWICYGQPNCVYNASMRGIDEVGVRVNQSWDQSGNQNGFVTFHGFTDKWGNISNTCTSISNDCVPLIIDHVPAGVAATRTALTCDCETFEYDYYYNPTTMDVYPVPGSPGSGWLTVDKIKHPN